MFLLCSSDWHSTPKTPRCRIDDYPTAQERKILHMFTAGVERRVAAFCQAGDLSDMASLPYSLYERYFLYFRHYLRHFPFCTIYGQHDLRYRAQDNTFFHAMETVVNATFAPAARRFIVADNSPYIIDPPDTTEKGVAIYGASFGEEIPEIFTPDRYNVLIIHRMIIDKKLWDGQKDFTKGTELLRKTKYDLIVSGDNHQHFHKSINGRHLINCGSLMRSTIDQYNHEPVYYIVDTKARTAECIKLPAAHAVEVFSKEQVIKKQNRIRR